MSAHVPGCHALLDLYACDVAILSDAGSLQTALQEAARAVNATILSAHFHTFGVGGGVTGVLLLAESHISIHTWPEHAFAAVDIFLCGTHQPQAACTLLQQALGAQNHHLTLQQRGENVA